jgi:hypothetical protein
MIPAENSDRRKSRRLKGRKEAILITPNGMHGIRDISEGGLSFHCGEDEFFPLQWPVEIIYAGTVLYMKAVPVRLVREEFEEVDTVISVPTKEVAVEFLDLDEQNRVLLDKLLQYHTSSTTERIDPTTRPANT